MASRGRLLANSFVKQYYHALLDNKELLLKLYAPGSTLSHGEASEGSTPVTGVDGIKARLEELTYTFLDVQDGFVDVHDNGDSLLIMVTGFIELAPSPQRRAFSQTFVLARVAMANGAESWYVKNDCLRVLKAVPAGITAVGVDIDAVAPTAADHVMTEPQMAPEFTEPAVALTPTASVDAATVEDATAAVEPQVHDAPAAAAPAPVAASPAPARDPKPRRGGKTAATHAAPPAPVVDAVDAAAAASGPRSYASIAAAVTAAPAPAPAPAPARTRGAPRTSAPAPAPAAPAPAGDAVQFAFIRNLAHGTTNEQLREAFSIFGDVTEISHPSEEHAYVYFATADALAAAVQRNTLTINGRPVNILMGRPRNGVAFRGPPPRRGGGGNGGGGGRSPVARKPYVAPVEVAAAPAPVAAAAPLPRGGSPSGRRRGGRGGRSGGGAAAPAAATPPAATS